jgi:hypothetical protein
MEDPKYLSKKIYQNYKMNSSTLQDTKSVVLLYINGKFSEVETKNAISFKVSTKKNPSPNKNMGN